jgi:hypothetical protein
MMCINIYIQKKGGNVYIYWVATYLWDSFLFLLLTSLFMCVLYAYGDETAMVFLQPNEVCDEGDREREIERKT